MLGSHAPTWDATPHPLVVDRTWWWVSPAVGQPTNGREIDEIVLAIPLGFRYSTYIGWTWGSTDSKESNMTHEQAQIVRMIRGWVGVRAAAKWCRVVGIDINVALVWCVR